MKSDSPLNAHAKRQGSLRAEMEEQRLPCLLVTNLTNIAYLTGFRGSAGVALFTPREGVLWVDPRYTLQAQGQARGVEVMEERKGLHKAAAEWLKANKMRRIGYEEAHLTCADFSSLQQGAGQRVKFVPAAGLVEQLRAVKDTEEVAKIRGAGKITVEVFEKVLGEVRPGVSESELSAEIEYLMRKKGAEGAAFETIVASGPRAALPHARASCKLLKENEFVIFDLGAILNDYAADMTRTVYLGEPSRRVRSLYNAVLEAQEKALRAVLPGVRAGDVDAVVRRALAGRGLARFFTHSTGHGVGMNTHEMPRLSRGEKARLQAGHVVTVEPGIYLEGLGGIRIEDTLLVGPAGPEVLTPARKDQWVVE
ncbi:MAG: M24 family metallopeptidase [Terriglobia bacterium]